MAFVLYLFLTFKFCLFATAKHSHPVPTFFGRLDSNGNIIDRASPDYYAGSENIPRINEISSTDLMNIKLETWPKTVKNGGKVTIVWSGIDNPQANDYIAYYCPYHDAPENYIDYIPGKEITDWEKGYGHYDVIVYNMRESCDFKLYRPANKTHVLAARSNTLDFADGGTEAPLQGHISMTNDPTQMRVMWTSALVTKPPIVRYGLTKKMEMNETAHLTHSYTKDDMCQSPANGKGFRHPGYIYDVLLKDLKPNTFYYYSYGIDGYMSETANFTTSLPGGDPTPYKFIVYGDMGVDPSPQAYATAANVRKEIEENDVRFVFHHGDVSYARGYAYIWEQWFRLTEPYATLIPYMVGVGNHEYDHTAGGIGRDPSGVKTDGGWKPHWFNGGRDSGGECGVPMFHRYHMPENGNSLFWYSYDYGMVHMIMMSTEHDFSPGSSQYTWLENDLKKVNRSITPWVLVGGHRPMYFSQKAAPSDYIVATNMQRLFEDLLHKYKVDLALWAHNHSYERTCKVYKNICVEDGITHIVVGTGGKYHNTNTYYKKKWSVFRLSDYGYGRVTVANTTAMLFEYVTNEHYVVKDHVWLYHNEKKSQKTVIHF